MEISTEKYNRARLLEYINSKAYRDAAVIPISPERALSHINNPRIDEEDVILITANDGDKLLGYRTAMADWVFNGNEKIKVAWISGTWIDPNYRRRGLASKLFIELNRSWNSSLMYTNYAPASKKLYDKTKVFETYRTHYGKRFYLRFNTAEIVPSRFSRTRFMSPLLTVFDKFMNVSILPFVVRNVNSSLSGVAYPTTLSENQIKRLFEKSLSGRGKAELDWILSNPWIIDDSVKENRDKKRYFFSWIANPYRLYFLLYNQGSENESVFMISVKGGKMKVPYYWLSEKSTAFIGEILIAEAKKNKVSEIDLFDEKLIAELKKTKRNFIFSKSQERKYMVSKHIIHKFPDSNTVKVLDGEGDVVFV